MIVISAAVFGALLGMKTAGHHGGRSLDKLQYGAGFAIAFALLGLFATIYLERQL